MNIRKKLQKKNKDEIISIKKKDRRLLSNVPDPENIRNSEDRRGSKKINEINKKFIRRFKDLNERYLVEFPVTIKRSTLEKKSFLIADAVDISATGILVKLGNLNESFEKDHIFTLSFNIPSGVMAEGFESKVKIKAKIVRVINKKNAEDEKYLVAFEFEKDLYSYFQKRRWGYSVYTASGFMFVSLLAVMLMRIESVVYFKYNMTLYLYSIIAASFLLSRYLFGSLYREVPINKNYTPGVSIIIPCFNEEEWINRTILSCINQDYPIDKLEVIIVDDFSNDKSVEKIQETVEILYKEAKRFKVKERVKVLLQTENKGKREALVVGVKAAKHDLVVFVDSDSFLDSTAIKNIVQPFQDPKMGGVAGRTDVENKFTNYITKMQTVRYYIAFRIMKAAESYFDSVTCLSGPLSCYKKELIIRHESAWLNQKFLGHPATFGDDRSMTNFILRDHRTAYQDSAICSTIVPSKMSVFLKQQMRWKRSWLRESLIAASFIWKKEPFMFFFFYIGLIVPIAAPIVVVYNLMYFPIVYKVFPTTFLLGILLMSLLMSFAHLIFKKSKVWVYGLVFCIFYEVVLLWQMPVAWVTFWKSTWGTRDTPQDIEAREKKNRKKKIKDKFMFKK